TFADALLQDGVDLIVARYEIGDDVVDLPWADPSRRSLLSSRHYARASANRINGRAPAPSLSLRAASRVRRATRRRWPSTETRRAGAAGASPRERPANVLPYRHGRSSGPRYPQT